MRANYNERLAEILDKVDDRTYKQTAAAIREHSHIVNFYNHYLTHERKIPMFRGINVVAVRKGIEQLERELNEEENKVSLTSLTSSTLTLIIMSLV